MPCPPGPGPGGAICAKARRNGSVGPRRRRAFLSFQGSTTPKGSPQERESAMARLRKKACPQKEDLRAERRHIPPTTTERLLRFRPGQNARASRPSAWNLSALRRGFPSQGRRAVLNRYFHSETQCKKDWQSAGIANLFKCREILKPSLQNHYFLISARRSACPFTALSFSGR